MNTNTSKLEASAVSEFLASRRSTRDFQAKPIPQEVLDQVLTDAMTAASWSNTRAFKIAVASGEVRNRLSAEFIKRWDALQRGRNGSLVDKLRLALTRYGLPTSNLSIAKPYVKELLPRAQRVGKELYEVLGVPRGDKVARDLAWRKNYEFFGAPTEMFIFVHKSLGIHSASDAGLMMANLMLSAHAHGLGTCAQGAVSVWDEAVKAEFDIPKGYRLLTGLAIGYPTDAEVNRFGAHRIGFEEVVILPKK